MNGPLLMDTDVFLLLLRQRDAARELDVRYGLATSPSRPLVSSVSLGEALAYATAAGWRHRDDNWLLKASKSFVVVDLSADVLHEFGHLAALYPELGDNDIWIVATARVCGATILTCDARLAAWTEAREHVELVGGLEDGPAEA